MAFETRLVLTILNTLLREREMEKKKKKKRANVRSSQDQFSQSFFGRTNSRDELLAARFDM